MTKTFIEYVATLPHTEQAEHVRILAAYKPETTAQRLEREYRARHGVDLEV